MRSLSITPDSLTFDGQRILLSFNCTRSSRPSPWACSSTACPSGQEESSAVIRPAFPQPPQQIAAFIELSRRISTVRSLPALSSFRWVHPLFSVARCLRGPCFLTYLDHASGSLCLLFLWASIPRWNLEMRKSPPSQSISFWRSLRLN